jgi:hypothetical protein
MGFRNDTRDAVARQYDLTINCQVSCAAELSLGRIHKSLRRSCVSWRGFERMEFEFQQSRQMFGEIRPVMPAGIEMKFVGNVPRR